MEFTVGFKPSNSNADKSTDIQNLELQRHEQSRLQKAESLRYVQEAIESLQHQLDQKNKQVEKYRKMAKEARMELIEVSVR